jgi:hypothetical protein
MLRAASVSSGGRVKVRLGSQRGASAASRAALALVVTLAMACGAPKVRSTAKSPPTPAEMAELWVEPADLASRDLFHGPGGAGMTPDPKARWQFEAADTTGTSRGYDVRDANGLVWDVKIGEEAQAEVVVSRLLWAGGYHQFPTYYVEGWTLIGGKDAGPQPPARFRPKLPGRDKKGEWSWQENRFVGTRPYGGLIVLNLMLNNWDFKTSNNAIYELDPPVDGVRRWYVVKDVGAALGYTPGWYYDGQPSDLEAFEKQGFVKSVDGDRVRFDYTRPHTELLEQLTPADVRWTSERLQRLSAQQWRDAFRAGGYSDAHAERYIRKLQAKIAEGLALPR